jgi:hypothetical protein
MNDNVNRNGDLEPIIPLRNAPEAHTKTPEEQESASRFGFSV